MLQLEHIISQLQLLACTEQIDSRTGNSQSSKTRYYVDASITSVVL
jgi:hypothetical protein